MNADKFYSLPILRLIAESLPIGISWATLTDGSIRHTNSEFDRIFGYPNGFFQSPEHLVETCYVHERHRQSMRDAWLFFDADMGTGVTTIPETEIEIITADGEVRSILHFGLILHEQKLAIAIFKDISAFKQERETLKSAALLDPLTGAMNRRGLQDRWRKETAPASDGGNTRVAVLLIDLDGFKPINDTYGHDVGDTVLIAVADRIRAAVRGTDVVSRIGGDEFAVLITRSNDSAHIEPICQRILDTLCQPFNVEGHQIRISASIGGCFYSSEATTLREALLYADRALYTVKNNGKSDWAWWKQVSASAEGQEPNLAN